MECLGCRAATRYATRHLHLPSSSLSRRLCLPGRPLRAPSGMCRPSPPPTMPCYYDSLIGVRMQTPQQLYAQQQHTCTHKGPDMREVGTDKALCFLYCAVIQYVCVGCTEHAVSLVTCLLCSLYQAYRNVSDTYKLLFCNTL